MNDQEKNETNEIDKRKHKRIPVRFKIENWPIPNLKDCKIFSHNLSVEGMLIEISPPLEDAIDLSVGNTIDVSFLLPQREEYLTVSSEIVWKNDKTTKMARSCDRIY